MSILIVAAIRALTFGLWRYVSLPVGNAEVHGGYVSLSSIGTVARRFFSRFAVLAFAVCRWGASYCRRLAAKRRLFSEGRTRTDSLHLFS
jgi:hypothetical protein